MYELTDKDRDEIAMLRRTLNKTLTETVTEQTQTISKIRSPSIKNIVMKMFEEIVKRYNQLMWDLNRVCDKHVTEYFVEFRNIRMLHYKAMQFASAKK